MGGASSYLAILCIVGFLSTTWVVSKLSRLVGISSIVLEIATGVVFGPSVLGLISEEYAECEHKRHTKCEVPGNVNELVASNRHIGHLGQFIGVDSCDFDAFMALEHDAAAQNASHGNSSSPGARRRFGGGRGAGIKHSSFSECLSKTCEAEVAHKCALTPDMFTMIGHAGVALMIFGSGMHFDFEKARAVGMKACLVAVLGTALPLAAGSLLMVAYGRPFNPDGISAGTALAPTSIGIALRLLSEAGVLQQNFGQAIITAAFVDDILSLVLFNVLLSLGGEFDLFKTVLAPITGIIFMTLAMVAAVKVMPRLVGAIMDRAPETVDDRQKGLRHLHLKKKEVLFLLQATVLVAYSAITHLLGTHLWGCFIAGMSFACISPPDHAIHVWVHQTKRLTTWMIRIFFSCTVGFSIPVAKLLSLSAFWKGSIMGIVACILTKVCCAPFMGEARWVVGWAMVGRAEFAYLIAQMALAGNMMDEEAFSIVIWALLYATILAPFAFTWVLNRYIRAQALVPAKSSGTSDDMCSAEPEPRSGSERTSQIEGKRSSGRQEAETSGMQWAEMGGMQEADANPMKDSKIAQKEIGDFL